MILGGFRREIFFAILGGLLLKIYYFRMNVSNLIGPAATTEDKPPPATTPKKELAAASVTTPNTTSNQPQLIPPPQQQAAAPVLPAAGPSGAMLAPQPPQAFASLPQYQLPSYPQAPMSKYSQLLAIMDEMGKAINHLLSLTMLFAIFQDIRPLYTGNRNSQERLKKGMQAAKWALLKHFFKYCFNFQFSRQMVQQCLVENNKKMLGGGGGQQQP
jgi:hypothetical protein